MRAVAEVLPWEVIAPGWQNGAPLGRPGSWQGSAASGQRPGLRQPARAGADGRGGQVQ